ncbi:LysE family transporter [uncultured Nitratireductor sp.]|uniref:LysE family translocator n=1 Tax=uncultured Nitratireductor sp. TaxID=520953 RepID=UPI0025EA0D17|nr:LysE family transporter [uncultured Nitratireductor sp.]
MDVPLFGKSLLLGLAVAAPLGPIGALCVNRTLERGLWAGLAGGLGTAFADAVYAALAAIGFAAFAAALAVVDEPLRLVGGAFLAWLGWKSLSPAPMRTESDARAGDLIGTATATFFLTIANPMTILTFAAMFAGLGLAGSPRPADALVVVTGVFLGSLLWWFILSGGVALVCKGLPEGLSLWVSRISGVILLAFALFAIGSVLRGHL